VKIPGDAKQGKAVFMGKGTCLACHKAGDIPGTPVGPDLSQIAKIQTPDYIMRKILDPKGLGTVANYPPGVMPQDFGTRLARAFNDGASAAQRFVHVTLPSLRNIVIIVVLLSTIWTFNDFGIVYILTKGGPGGATMVLPVLTYETAFGAQRLGEAIAVALYMLPPLAFVIIVLSNYMRKGRTR